MPTSSSDSAEANMAGPNSRIIVLDDDPKILDLLKRMIESIGFQCDAHLSAMEALKALQDTEYQCVISDQFMPEMNGLEFFAKAEATQPLASRILITGAANLTIAIKAINSGLLFHFLTKPVTSEILEPVLLSAISKHRLLAENIELQRETQKLNNLLSIANQSLEKNFDHSLDLCRNLAATFSPLLGKTTRSVEEICSQFCGLGLMSKDEEKVLCVSATLHNVGLIGIPRELIQASFRRPHMLTDDQRSLIEKHPLYGETVVEFVGQLSGVAETIRAHHERWDGLGYPDGLREEAIPLPARYLAVACAFVESGHNAEDSFRQINADSNTKFYPEAVRAFSKIFHGSQLPKKVREITFNELRPGMTLAKALYSPAGLLLLPEGKVVEHPILRKIRNHNIMDHVKESILVYT